MTIGHPLCGRWCGWSVAWTARDRGARDWGKPMASSDLTADCAVCFSGGKDSMLALDRAVRGGRRIRRLVTLYDTATERVRFHAVPIAVMQAQAEALGIPMRCYPTTPAT